MRASPGPSHRASHSSLQANATVSPWRRSSSERSSEIVLSSRAGGAPGGVDLKLFQPLVQSAELKRGE